MQEFPERAGAGGPQLFMSVLNVGENETASGAFAPGELAFREGGEAT